MIYAKIPIWFFAALLVGIVAPSFVYASSDPLSLNPSELLNKTFSGSSNTGNSLPNLPGFKLPLDLQKGAKSFLSGANTGDGIDFGQLLNTKNLSSSDFGTALKAVAVLAINLFLIVIQTVASILKALLPFLQ